MAVKMTEVVVGVLNSFLFNTLMLVKSYKKNTYVCKKNHVLIGTFAPSPYPPSRWGPRAG